MQEYMCAFLAVLTRKESKGFGASKVWAVIGCLLGFILLCSLSVAIARITGICRMHTVMARADQQSNTPAAKYSE